MCFIICYDNDKIPGFFFKKFNSILNAEISRDNLHKYAYLFMWF